MMTARPLAIAGGPRLAGAFMKCVRVRLLTPSYGATNTGATVTLSAMLLDPLKRAGAITFYIDRTANFGSDFAQNSSNVTGSGWLETAPISWVSSTLANGYWYWAAKSDLVHVGAGPTIGAGRRATAFTLTEAGGAGVPRALYLGVSKTLPAITVAARALYVGVSKVFLPFGVDARALYVGVSRTFAPVVVDTRALYLGVAKVDGEVFPYLNHLSPVEQYIGGQVELYGDGFGQYLDATEDSPTVSVSSTNGGNVAGNAKDRTQAEWQSTSGAGAWIRFTWPAAKRIVAIALEGSRNGTSWGVPRFTFDDATTQDGSSSVPAAASNSSSGDASGHVGPWRAVYWLATPKESTYVQVSVASGGSGTNRGLVEAWVIEEIVPAQGAEGASAILNLGLPAELAMGIVSWQNRSANWHPANGGGTPGPAALVTVPVGAESGLVVVEETI